MSTHREHLLNFRRTTPIESHHFFGYYDKFPWDSTSRYLLALEPGFIDRQPTADDTVRIGMVDTNEDRWIPIAETRAWNWQQSSMLHWLPTAADREIIHNDRDGNRFVSVIRDVFTGETCTLPLPIYCLRPDGKQAVTPNFARIAVMRPGYGYEGVEDPSVAVSAPDNNGIRVMNLQTGESGLVITLAQAASLDPKPSMEGALHWFNHLQYNTTGTRFLFLHRWSQTTDDGPRNTRLLTADPDGSDIRIIADDGMTSHFDWRDENTILAWARTEKDGDHYYLFDAMTGEYELVGPDVLECDGHCSYSPDREWILTDTYPGGGTRERTLILYHPGRDERIDIGRFYADPKYDGPTRTDLHPRWSRDGKSVCLDSVHERHGGDFTRQMYIADVSSIVRK
jgi:hypothetical protein